jgi:predicted HAD superfamily Cof-like phosphohydrolase
MNSEQNALLDFHRTFGLEWNDHPTEISEAEAALRIHLMEEELREVITAMAYEDLPAVAKELADLLYVVYGTAVSYGLDMEPIFAEVHRSNLTKLPKDGIILRREDGKIEKPPEYSLPDIATILEKQREYGDPE